MWHMLCARAKDLQIRFRDTQANATIGAAHWEAQYTFGKKSRPVHNVITATFDFRENLIVEYDDTFNLWKWTRMALGPTGTLLGWTPWLRSAVRRDARRGLDSFIQKQQGMP